MKLELVKTRDGSYTFHIPEWNEHYHSKYGAHTESNHIFIENGFKKITTTEVRILEIGFGTGLNTILTYSESEYKGNMVYYEAVEKLPLTWQQVESLNYHSILSDEHFRVLKKMHSCDWNKVIEFSENFNIQKIKVDLLNYVPSEEFHIIYFDAFAPDLQPELWSEKIFSKLYNCLLKGGILVTYSTKGDVKRNLKSAGFHIEKIPGPIGGKKENLRALKS